MKRIIKQAAVFLAAYAFIWIVATFLIDVLFLRDPFMTLTPYMKSIVMWSAFYAASAATNRYRCALADRAEISPVNVPGFAVYKVAAIVYLLVTFASWIVFRDAPALVVNPWIAAAEAGASFSVAHALKYVQLELTRPRRVFMRR